MEPSSPLLEFQTRAHLCEGHYLLALASFLAPSMSSQRLSERWLGTACPRLLFQQGSYYVLGSACEMHLNEC